MKILIIEDDAFFQRFYATKLTENGFEVVTASDGEEGLAKIAQTQPDVILLDMIMPKKDGFEVLQEIAKMPNAVHIPVIIFSSLGQEKDVQRAKELGAVDYINKSVSDIEMLMAKIFQATKVAPNQKT